MSQSASDNRAIQKDMEPTKREAEECDVQLGHKKQLCNHTASVTGWSHPKGSRLDGVLLYL